MRLLLVLAVLLAGCLGGDADAPPETVLENFVHVAPRGLPSSSVELNLNMTEGARMEWRFNASAPLVWDVHAHNATALDVFASGRDAEASGEFRAPRTAVFSVFLQNPSASRVEVTYRVAGHFQVVAGTR